jgi:V/A-type H+-transporting ATPase subunit F
MKYFVIGEREIVLALNLTGVEGKVAANRTEALKVFKEVTTGASSLTGVPTTEEKPTVLIITEDVSSWLEDEISDWQLKGNYPLIVEVPGLHGHLEGRKSLTDRIRESVGINI